jgi:AhpD family alkylhydroperoxidase
LESATATNIATTEGNITADPKVTELVALGAAVGSNCEACFRSHYETARDVGLSTEELVRAVSVAQTVKDTPSRRMLDLAARKLEVPVDALVGAADGPAADAGVDDAIEDLAPSSTDCC